MAPIAPVTFTGRRRPLLRQLADLSQEIAVAAVDFGFLSHLKELLRPRISLGVNAVADAGDKLIVAEPFFDGVLGDGVEIGLFGIRWFDKLTTLSASNGRQRIVQHLGAIF